jgi:hypothetical protein
LQVFVRAANFASALFAARYDCVKKPLSAKSANQKRELAHRSTNSQSRSTSSWAKCGKSASWTGETGLGARVASG